MSYAFILKIVDLEVNEAHVLLCLKMSGADAFKKTSSQVQIYCFYNTVMRNIFYTLSCFVYFCLAGGRRELEEKKSRTYVNS